MRISKSAFNEANEQIIWYNIYNMLENCEIYRM